MYRLLQDEAVIITKSQYKSCQLLKTSLKMSSINPDNVTII